MILVSVVAARFSSGLKRRGTITAGSGEGDLYYRTSDAASDRYKCTYSFIPSDSLQSLVAHRRLSFQDVLSQGERGDADRRPLRKPAEVG